ncbi:MAG TPA: serine hydrolase domain-containing protein [Pyrinomonadaceae bacterium]|nr:serine hydrolase domain-containing protein [Pyrinomonadaceae bacterium]
MSDELDTSRDDESISALLGKRIATGDFASAVYLVAQGGRVCVSGALGDAVREPERRAATLDTIYDLASLTKPLVTGLLAAILYERGEVNPHERVGHYLPEFARGDKTAITVQQLLTHTSGLAAWRPLYIIARGERGRAPEAIAAELLESPPGTRVAYSDLGFITLGFLIERITGASLAEVARAEIFGPLALKRTFFNPSETLRTEIAACESTGNAYERDTCRDDSSAFDSRHWRDYPIWGEVHDGNAFFLGGAAGHAGLFSTAHEVLRLAEQFIAGRTSLLKRETCALFRTNMTESLNEARSWAWQLAATKDSTAGPALPPESFGHLGFTGTSCWVDAARERVYILLTNRTHARPLPFVNINNVRRQFHTLASTVLDQST